MAINAKRNGSGIHVHPDNDRAICSLKADSGVQVGSRYGDLVIGLPRKPHVRSYGGDGWCVAVGAGVKSVAESWRNQQQKRDGVEEWPWNCPPNLPRNLRMGAVLSVGWLRVEPDNPLGGNCNPRPVSASRMN